MNILNRDLTAQKDGIPGYIAHPVSDGSHPGLLIVHHHYGLTGHLKSFACSLGQLGYTTVIPDLYRLLAHPEPYHVGTGSEVQAKTTDAQFVQVIGQGWRYLLGRSDVEAARVGVIGFCMGGRIGIHFAAATPSVRAFVGYYPSVRDEQPSERRPRHPCDAAREFRCPSLIYYGARDNVASPKVQERLWKSLMESGQPLEWHFFPHAGHGFALADGEGYDPNLASLVWPLTADFLARELQRSE